MKKIICALFALIAMRCAEAQTIEIGSGIIVEVGDLSFVEGGSVKVQAGGSLTLSSGATLSLSDTLRVLGTASFSNGSTLGFTNAGMKSLSGVSVVGNLSVSGSGLVSLQNPVTVNGLLTLTSGGIATGINTLTLNGAVSQTAGSVVGVTSRLVGTAPAVFPSGTAANPLPVTISFASGSAALTVTSVEMNPTAGRAGTPTNPLLALWTITGTPPSPATLFFQYPSAVRQSGFTQSAAFAARWNGSEWESFRTSSSPSPDLNPSPSSVTVTGVTQFSPWAIFHGGDDTPLPVELLSFTGLESPAGVRLEWKTASERENVGFEMIRESNVIASYRTVQGLIGAGTSSGERVYSFVDGAVELGKTYSYKLRSVDISGQAHEYPTAVRVQITEAVAPKVFEYALAQNYPNPFNPATIIRFTMKQSGTATIRIYDALGRTVSEEQFSAAIGENIYRFDASRAGGSGKGLASGMYFYRLQTPEFVRTKKMILAK